jgi:uncharacterized membrane protein
MSQPVNPPATGKPWKFGVREVVRSAIFSALVIVMHVSGIGSIPVPNVSGAMTTLLIPVILGAIIGGPLVGLVAGTVMGVMYLTMPATAAFGPITLIVPRLLMALAAWAVYKSLERLNVTVASALAAATGALTNTISAVGIAIMLGQVPVGVIWAVYLQAIIETIVCTIIVPPVILAVKAASRR